MITISELGQKGRLGNQLFHYALLLSIGAETGYEIKIPDYHNSIVHNQKCLLDNFNISASFYTEDDLNKLQYNYFESTVDFANYSYNPDVFLIPDNTNLYGWFQNYQYFEKHEDIIIKELTPKQYFIDENTEIINKIKEKYKGYEIVSLHLRKGDVGLFNINGLNMYGENPNILDINSLWYNYFIKAKNYFKYKKIKFFIFTGGSRIPDTKIDSDIEWCKNNLIGDEYIYYDYDRNTMNDFTLMLLCDHHILAPVASLSWWTAFLNHKKENRLIIAPRKYYYFEKELNYGFYPYNVIQI